MLRRRPLHLASALLLTGSALGSILSSGCDDDPAQTGGAGGKGSTASSTATGMGGSGGVHIAGLAGPVDAVYDPNGLLHLSCTTDEDCYAALGYFHAANRMFFMDFIRNLVRGRLGELVKAGDTVVDRDKANRLFFSTAQGKPLATQLLDDASPAVKGYMTAYTAGVNAWIKDMREQKNGATLTTEYDFSLIDKTKIRDWEPEDSAAVGLYVLNDLSNNSDDEISLGIQRPAYEASNPALADDLFTPKPVFDAFTTTLSMATAQKASTPSAKKTPSSAAFVELLGKARETTRLIGSGVHQTNPADIGSNNWCVGPSRTTDKHAILANDPHLVLTNPSIWFGVELDAKSNGGKGSFHVAGSTFPGLPSVMVGHNETLGWGVTTAYYDLADVYEETLTPDGKSVLFNGNPVPIIEIEAEFGDLTSPTPKTHTLRWVPHHGPVVVYDPANSKAVTVKWTGHAGGTDLDAFFGIAKAASVADAQEALKKVSSANQNFVVVDKDGTIGWYPYGSVPSRPFASTHAPWLPLPGTGAAEWGLAVPTDDLPQLTNPASGTIATANQDMTGASQDGDLLNDGQAALQAITKAEGTRQQRILDRIAQGANNHSVASMVDIQGDTYSLYGSVVTPAVLAAEAGQTLTANEQAVVDALSKWQFNCPTGLDGSDPATAAKSADPAIAADSIGCTVFHATLYSIVTEALADDVVAAGNVPISGERWDLHLVVRAIKDPASIASTFWDDVSTVGTTETRDDILRRAVTKAAAALAVSGPADDWRWGRFHTLSLRSIYDSFGVPTYNAPAAAAPGGQYTVNVANPSKRALPMAGMPVDFAFAAGPSVRFVVEAKPEGVTMSYQLPGGNDLHRESPFYNNLLPNWLVNKPITFPFGPGAVSNPAVTVHLEP